jgi:invasion protein IalB
MNLGLTALAFILFISIVSHSLALEDSRQGRFGAWRFNCAKSPPYSVEHCILSQVVFSKDDSYLGIGLIVLKRKEMKDALLQVIAPERVYLPKGVTLMIGNNERIQAGFIRCQPEGCRAEIILEEKLLRQFNSGQNGDLIIYMSPFLGMRHIIRFDGFSEGYANLK